jgi:hypothetical protein
VKGKGNSVAMLSDDLIARAKAIASRSDELLHLLEDARQRLLDPTEQPTTKEPPEAARRFEPKRASKKQAARRPARKGEIPEGLRLLTTQMSVAGANREQIAAQLRSEFGVADPERILRSMGL